MTRQQQLDQRNRDALARFLPDYKPDRKFRVKVFYQELPGMEEKTKTYTVKALDREDARRRALREFQENEYDLDLNYYGTSPDVEEV